jgi:hypothetical protein
LPRDLLVFGKSNNKIIHFLFSMESRVTFMIGLPLRCSGREPATRVPAIEVGEMQNDVEEEKGPQD